MNILIKNLGKVTVLLWPMLPVLKRDNVCFRPFGISSLQWRVQPNLKSGSCWKKSVLNACVYLVIQWLTPEHPKYFSGKNTKETRGNVLFLPMHFPVVSFVLFIVCKQVGRLWFPDSSGEISLISLSSFIKVNSGTFLCQPKTPFPTSLQICCVQYLVEHWHDT